jgi:23S rRNA (guanine2445-N2)-methyltransferase / 23S rRNA (guanine2069-N7)-methyltransferase
MIHFERRDVADLRPPPGATAGEIVTNPPFGARLGGSESAVRALMGTLGQALGRMPGFLAHVLVADEEMGFALGLRAPRSHRIMHGPLACTLLHIDCDPTQGALGARPTGGAVEALKNRLRKNLKGLTPYLQEHGIGSFRLYDSDLPEYAVAIDVYTAVGGAKHAHIQEYAAPQEVPPKVAQARLRQVLEAVGDIMELGPSDMALKVRRRQKPEDQYGAREARRLPTLRGPRAPSPEAQGFWVRENGLLFYVDLHRYVDTGLFLDHRRVRAWMLKHARGKHMLNLFGYTGSVSVAAAAGGALSTTTLDLSATYLSWAEQNLRQNALLEPRQRLVQADCLTWVRQNPKATYDIAFVNPPTFSNSKRMMEAFDVVRDHGMLLDATMAWVKKDGVALFTTHARRLRIDERLAQSYAITEISRSVRPKDFDRAKVGCRAWLIRHLGGA